MGVRSIGTTYVITVPNDSILLYISEIELTASTFDILSAFSRNSRSTIFFLLTSYCDIYQIHTSSVECRTDWSQELYAANSHYIKAIGEMQPKIEMDLQMKLDDINILTYHLFEN